MPISNAYISESVLPSEIIPKNGVVKSESSHSLNSSENSEKLYSDSAPASRLDSMHDKIHAFFPYKKEKKSFWTQRSSIHQLEDFSNNPRAYYSDFYDSTEQLPAIKKCENFHKKNAYSNSSSENDLFKRQATRRFSLSQDVLRKVETPKCRSLSFSSEDMDPFRIFQDFSDWNESFGKPSSTQKSVGSEESMSSSNFDNVSDSHSDNSADSDYEQFVKKSIHDYFKNSVNSGSTSSLCTSQSSSYAMSPFPEETVDPFEEIDDEDADADDENNAHQLLTSPNLSNDNPPLYSSLLNLRSTAAEQMLINLGFCHSSQLIPARFLQNWPKQENGEALKSSSKEEIETKLPENNQQENSRERLKDTVSKSSKKRYEDTVSKDRKKRRKDTVSKHSKERQEDAISKHSKERQEDTFSKNSKERQEVSISKNSKERQEHTISKNSKERQEHTISKNSKERQEHTISKNSKERQEHTISKNSKERQEHTISKNSKERQEDTFSKNSKERREDKVSKSKKRTEVDSNVEHLLMSKKNAFSLSNKSSSVDFEEINRSTVHIINNNKHVFYKQKSILDEIEEANRNTLSATFKNKPNDEMSPISKTKTNTNNCDQEIQTAQNYSKPSFKKNINITKEEKDLLLLQKNNDSKIDTENTFCSRTPSIHISNQIPVSKISEKSQESFEIECIFNDSKQKSAEFITKSKKEKNSNEESCVKSTDNRSLNTCSFLSVSCTSSPAESPLTVIDVPVQNIKDRISATSEEYNQNRINNSSLSIDYDSDDTLNNISNDQFDENSSNFPCIQEELTNSKKFPSISIKVSKSPLSDITDSGVGELYSKEDESCCQNGNQLKPYLTFGPDVVTIYKDSSEVNNEDTNTTKLSPPGFYTSNFNMFINSPQKKRVNPQYQSLDERKKSRSMTFSPLVINEIRFDGSNQSKDNFSERGFGDGEDAMESKVFNAVSYFSSGPKIEKTAHCFEKSEKKRDEYSLTENKGKNCSACSGKENKNHCSEIKVSKANITFKLDSQNSCNNKMSSKVIIKNINCSHRKWPRQRSNHTSDKHTKDSWTQCNFEDHLNKRNLCNNNNINYPIQNYSNKYLLKNSCQQTADLHMESKDRNMLPIFKKGMLTSASIKKNANINVDFQNLKDDTDELDFSTDFKSTSRRLKNSCTEKAILSLHKSSQTRTGGLHPLCKNELNICAKCLNHTNSSC